MFAMIIPVIIYRDRKSGKELREEMEREREWRELMEKEEAKRHAAEERKRRERLRAKLAREEALRKEIQEAERRNPWEYRVLPGGWDLLGQTPAVPIPWDGTEEDWESLTVNE